MTATIPTGSDTERRDALVDQLFQATIVARELMHVYVGDRLGFYTALADLDAASPVELADRAGIAERYAREWLEQQAVAGVLDLADDTGDARTRRYRLPPGAADVLCDPDGLYFLAPLAITHRADAPSGRRGVHNGRRVPFEAYGEDIRTGIERVNRPMFLNSPAPSGSPRYGTSRCGCAVRIRRRTSPISAADPVGDRSRPPLQSLTARREKPICSATASSGRGRP